MQNSGTPIEDTTFNQRDTIFSPFDSSLWFTLVNRKDIYFYFNK